MEKESASFVCEISHDEVDCQWLKGSIKLKVGDNIKMRQEGITERTKENHVVHLPAHAFRIQLCYRKRFFSGSRSNLCPPVQVCYSRRYG